MKINSYCLSFMALVLLVLCAARPAWPREALPVAEDPVIEKRLNTIAEEMRCLVCQNESLAGSRADLALDLRRELREQIKAGKTDEEIRSFMVDRYGDFVLYRPPVKSTTWVLWMGPFLLSVVGLGVLWWMFRRRKRGETSACDAGERVDSQGDLAEDEPSSLVCGDSVPVWSWRSGLLWGSATLLVAVGLYLLLGNPAALHPRAPVDQQSIEKMVAGLAARLEANPDNPQGWMMLARAYQVLGRLPEAEKAYERIGQTINNDPDLLTAYAEVAAENAGGRFTGKPDALIAQALKRDAQHPNAQWLAGSSAFARGDFEQAIRLWTPLLQKTPPGSENAQVLEAAIAQAQEQVSPRGKSPPQSQQGR
jgi:cytochrome c-type biogenesis protein CcmH